METNDTCAYVNNFITDLLNGNIEIVYSRAKSLVNYIPEKGILGSEKRKDERPFSSIFGNALTEYQRCKANPVLRKSWAEICFQYVIWANTHQIIRRTGLINKINDLKKENIQLKEEKDKYQKEIARLTLLNEALHEAMGKFGKRMESDNEEESEGSEE